LLYHNGSVRIGLGFVVFFCVIFRIFFLYCSNRCWRRKHCCTLVSGNEFSQNVLESGVLSETFKVVWFLLIIWAINSKILWPTTPTTSWVCQKLLWNYHVFHGKLYSPWQPPVSLNSSFWTFLWFKYTKHKAVRRIYRHLPFIWTINSVIIDIIFFKWCIQFLLKQCFHTGLWFLNSMPHHWFVKAGELISPSASDAVITTFGLQSSILMANSCDKTSKTKMSNSTIASQHCKAA
jgi:hypothetical protein